MTNLLLLNKKSIKKNYVFTDKEHQNIVQSIKNKKDIQKPFNSQKIIESINEVLKEI